MSLEDAINRLNVNYSDAIKRISNKPSVDSIQVCPTDINSLNIALGVGGIPVGRLIEIFGTDSCGKSTLIQHIISKFQLRTDRPRVLALNYEAPWNWLYIKKLGILLDEDHFIYYQPDYLEMGLDICNIFIEEDNQLGLICIDSIAAATPKEEYEGHTIDDKYSNLQSTLMSLYLRKLVGKASKAGITLLFTNQIREKVNSGDIYTPCGRATKFYASVRIELSVPGYIYSETNMKIGHILKFEIVKNNCAVPYRTAECRLLYGEGFKEIENANVAS